MNTPQVRRMIDPRGKQFIGLQIPNATCNVAAVSDPSGNVAVAMTVETARRIAADLNEVANSAEAQREAAAETST